MRHTHTQNKHLAMIDKYKRGGIGFVIAKLDTVFKTSSGVLGLTGKEIINGDPEYQKERRAQIFGEVMMIPVSLGKKPLYQVPIGIPKYGAIRLPEADIDVIHDAVYARAGNGFKWFSDMAPEVQVGDRVYFSWTNVHDQRNMIAKSPDGKSFIFKIAYDTIYCVVREGKIIPIGGHVLIDPVWESFESILRPTYYDFKDKFGKPIAKPKSEWIQVKSAPKHVDREGVVAHIGTPLKGDTCVLKPGMKVLYKPKLQNLLDVEGNKYFIVRQNQILLYSA